MDLLWGSLENLRGLHGPLKDSERAALINPSLSFRI